MLCWSSAFSEKGFCSSKLKTLRRSMWLISFCAIASACKALSRALSSLNGVNFLRNKSNDASLGCFRLLFQTHLSANASRKVCQIEFAGLSNADCTWAVIPDRYARLSHTFLRAMY